ILDVHYQMKGRLECPIPFICLWLLMPLDQVCGCSINGPWCCRGRPEGLMNTEHHGTGHPRAWRQQALFVTTVALLLSGLLGPSSAHASDLQFNLGVEGGPSVAQTPSKKGGHIALRTSVVELDFAWSWGRSIFPRQWLGAYGRLERNVQDSRAVIGVGHSLPTGGGILGVESGLVFARDGVGRLGGGAELTGFFTLGVGALYVRRSYVHTETGRWQTDVGLRLLLPLTL
ncbi:MAG: hypothetical protein VX938_07540, partial [Myxococcota bacterium]|nr:hypothetical protein [Myxococcota bacterium]